jgi:hypothetical protein
MFLVGMKFGATGNEAATWAMNSYLPGVVCRRFHSSRIAGGASLGKPTFFESREGKF